MKTGRWAPWLLGVLVAVLAVVLLRRAFGTRTCTPVIPPDATAVVCAIAKNEGMYIDEWIAYNIKLGFDNIYVYDNSDDNDLADLPAKSPVK